MTTGSLKQKAQRLSPLRTGMVRVTVVATRGVTTGMITTDGCSVMGRRRAEASG